VNRIKSIYPLDDFERQTIKYAKEGKLVVTNRSKAENLFDELKVQTFEASSILDLAEDSIPQSDEAVKRYAEYLSRA